jgi:hypothetical protein
LGQGYTDMPMGYEDMVAIGGNLNTAIERVLEQQLGEINPQLVAALAQGILVQLDQAGYKIERK